MRMGPSRFGQRLAARPVAAGLLRTAARQITRYPVSAPRPRHAEQSVLGIERAALAHSWEVLREFGNMSSATALFVLKRALRTGAHGPHLLAAFGPGFSAYFIVADL